MVNEKEAQAIENVIGKEMNDGVANIIEVGFRRLVGEATIPVKAHASDSGFDLVASEDAVIRPGETVIVPTGIAVQLPDGYEAQVRPRSGVTSKTKLRVQLGTIDNGYTGGIGVIVDNINPSKELSYYYHEVVGGYVPIDNGESAIPYGTYLIRKGDRIAQLVVQELPKVQAVEVFDVQETERGGGGYGSTGVVVQ